MYCPKCGTQTESSNYCRSCGANLTRVAKVISDPQSNRPRSLKRSSGSTFTVFNSTKLSNKERDLDGYNVSSIFGSVTVDLKAAPLPPGETRIYLHSVFGSIDVFVPDDVGIRITGNAVFGSIELHGKGISGGIFSVKEYTSPGYAQAARRLHIDATTVFAGINIKG